MGKGKGKGKACRGRQDVGLCSHPLPVCSWVGGKTVGIEVEIPGKSRAA